MRGNDVEATIEGRGSMNSAELSRHLDIIKYHNIECQHDDDDDDDDDEDDRKGGIAHERCRKPSLRVEIVTG